MINYSYYWYIYNATPFHTNKPSKFYFHIPEIKRLDSAEQLNSDELPTLYTEFPILAGLYSCSNWKFTNKEHYFPLPLKETFGIRKFNRITSSIEYLNEFSYFIYETKKEIQHHIGGKSVLFDENYNLLFLTTAKVIQIPAGYMSLIRENSNFSDLEYIEGNSYDHTYVIYKDTTINVSNLLVNKAKCSKLYSNILIHLMDFALRRNWKFNIVKDLTKKWIAIPTAPKLEDIKVPLNTYIKEELNDIIDKIAVYG